MLKFMDYNVEVDRNNVRINRDCVKFKKYVYKNNSIRYYCSIVLSIENRYSC